MIPLESLPAFQEIVIMDKRINSDEQLMSLADTISEAMLMVDKEVNNFDTKI